MNFPNTDIKFLIREEKNEDAKFIIKNYNFYDFVDILGVTLMHYSAQCGNYTILKYLVDAGCNINVKDYRGRTPLMYALAEEKYHAVKTLLKAGADILITNSNNESSLRLLLRKNELNEEILKLTLEQLKRQCSSIDKVAWRLIHAGGRLDHAIHLKKQNARVIEYMVQQGFSVNYVHNAEHGRTILHLAVLQCDIECVKVLLKYKANASATNARGRTPLNYLFSDHIHRRNPNQIEILKILLDAGAMPMSLCSGMGDFQISSTLTYGPREAIRLLLKLDKLNFEVSDDFNQNTVLHYLARNRNFGIAEELEEYGNKLNPNVVDRGGGTPLHYAAYSANIDMLKYFLKHGAKINVADEDGATPLISAFSIPIPELEYHSDQCIEILLQHNIDPQHVAIKNNEPLTVFDLVITTAYNGFEDRVKPVVAQIALLEKCSIPITDLIYFKMNSRPQLQKYFVDCRKFLGRKICGSVSFFKLFKANEKTVAKLLNDQKLVTKLMRINRKQKLVSSFSYYRNTLKKRLTKIILHKKLKVKAVVAISQLFGNCIDESNIIVEKIVGYLDERDLKQVYYM